MDYLPSGGNIVVLVCVMLHRKKEIVATKRAKLAVTNCSVLTRMTSLTIPTVKSLQRSTVGPITDAIGASV